MEAVYSGLTVVGWHLMLESWWDKLLASFLLATIVIGSMYIVYRIYLSVKSYWKARQLKVVVPAPVARYLERLRSSTKRLSQLPLSLKRASSEELKSFGVYLGSFDNPPTLSQARLLSQWDVLVLNPLEEGVLDALTICRPTSKHILGRLRVATLARSDASPHSEDVIKCLFVLSQAMITHFQSGPQSPFTGVVLAEFQSHFQPAVLNSVVKYITGLGIDVWLEMGPPEYLSERDAREINMELIRGIICRNGTIRPDGDRQNYFQMTEMRTAQRLIAAQRVVHGPPMMMWETINDSAELQYAVVQRSFNWCRFNSTLVWIGQEAALTDADSAAALTVAEKPLGALMWMKNDDNMKAHDVWRANDQISQTSCGHEALYGSLHEFVPDLAARLSLLPPPEKKQHAGALVQFRQPAVNDYGQTNPLTAVLSTGVDSWDGLGCYQLGLEVTPKAFSDLLQGQRNLQDLELLQRIPGEELHSYGEQIAVLLNRQTPKSTKPATFQAISELVGFLRTGNDDDSSRIQVYSGLHSGFQTDAETQFWGFYDVDNRSGVVTLYLSNKTPDRAGTILHTFLSSRGHSRSDCFIAELAMAEQNDLLSEMWQLPPRIVHDVKQLSPAETILFLRRLVLSKRGDDSVFWARVRTLCEYQLIEVPTLTQLREMNSVAYLRGEVSAETVINARIAWLGERGCWIPDPSAAVALFKEVDTRLYEILMNGNSETLAQLSVVMQTIVQENRIDAGADIFALAVFSAFRKLALDEVYLEVLDRNVLPNHATDQAGCFAEHFGLGSRCDSFFDMTPRVLGRIISDRYRAYYMEFQPPQREEGFTELPTAYAPMQVDIDPADGQEVMAWYHRITFLGIFAVPALIDIMLLTTIGRGLYLTTFMTSAEKTMATTALMLALLVCGAAGSWISSGGSYYFYANAFPAMNMFVLTRFVAGVAFALVGGLGGMAGIMVVKGVTAGLVFIFYFGMLTTYLLTLSTLSIYQLPGSRFQSGRTIIMTCIPILFISPVLTLWVQHDIIVYPCILTFFLVSLLLGARKILSQWSTWYLNIPHITDTEVVNWYMKIRGSRRATTFFEGDIKDIGMSPHPRRELHNAVLREQSRHFWQSKTTDPLVSELAEGYSKTVFLMQWYCKHKRSAMPLPYSATWNLTLKAGLENMTNTQKGLKLHSAFLHWRHTGDDIWSGLLYFVVALLDKWAALVSGGNLVGLSAASSAEFRLSVGFGLCYYLIGAVSLDSVSQPLWTAANQKTIQPITSLKFLRQATINDGVARRALYWHNLLKFFFLHIWGMAITGALMWIFEDSRSATIMYLAYIGAYSGLLWYQYNKIYCGVKAAPSLMSASIIGLPIGIALHVKLPEFAYSGIVSLAIGTWIAGFHSMYIAKIGWPRIFRLLKFKKSASTMETEYKEVRSAEATAVTYSSSALEPYPDLSQATLSKTFQSICALPADVRFTLDPSQNPGDRIMEILLFQINTIKSEHVKHAFPQGEELIQRTAELWGRGQTVIELVSARHVPQQGQKIRTISRKSGDLLYIFVILGLDLVEDEWILNIHRNCRIIAEAVVQATSEAQLGLSHDDSMLAEMLAVIDNGSDDLYIPEGIKRQLETSSSERARVISNGDKILLRYLLLGLDCEREWDHLPKSARSYLLKRCCGQSDPLSVEEERGLRSTIFATDSLELGYRVARCDLGATLAVSVYRLAKELEATRSYEKDEQELQDQSYNDLLSSSSTGNGSDPKLFSRFYRKFRTCIKFLVLSLTADPEYQRELDFMLRAKPLVVHWPVTFFLNGIWSYCKWLQGVIIPLVLFHKRENILKLHDNMKGMKTVIEKKNRIVIESLNCYSTCFLSPQSDGSIKLSQYTGRHDSEPSENTKLIAVNTYTDKLVLRQREEFNGQGLVNFFTYQYPQGSRKSKSKLPIQRQCINGDFAGQTVQYDHRGYITSGSFFRGVNPVQFKYEYRKNAKFEDELLRGEYVLGHITIKVQWCVPPRNHAKRLDEWIPWTKVTQATFAQGNDVYHAIWTYEHKFHPEITTTLNGEPVQTPPMIEDDWFYVLQKPDNCGFLSNNPLLSFSSVRSNFITRILGLNVKRYPIPTSHARTVLWNSWKGGKDLDAITARWLDEGLMRSDKILNSYWRNRDLGLLDAAKDYLDAQADTIMARTDVDPDISSWVHIAFKMSDLYSFGQGGDSRINTRTLSKQLRDSDDELHILAMDTSTWPNEPGGVSACRRDMVNDLKTIKWHIVAESANDYGVPRFQIERNVQSLTILPLWGLDFMNPTHGILESYLDSAIVQRSYDTRTADIKMNFLPILTSLVQCSRTRNFTRKHIEEATKALVDLNTYFESTRNWNDVWMSDIVKQTWRELWLAEDLPDSLPVSQWWDFEKPTMQQLDQALDMWHRYLFIFSIPVPEKIPHVFQASHHFTGATYGILCKVKRNCTLHVWDHCISFREFTTFMSSAVSFDTPFINSSLISLGHLSCVLLEHHADVVLPCCDYFNPGWEVELGTAEGSLEHRRTFARKIDPVVNGICNMEKFEPIQTIKTDKPTVVMLSHIQYVKDIKSAIMATDLIVNRWGFTDYVLHIYGDMERAASHSTECQELIASKGLRDHCVLKGLGNASLVLQDAWLFLNSSISEGLPLAMGEAALTGVPVVCTDVGASFCVVTDRVTGDRFSEVVPPNDSESLARAQISVLALLGKWAKHADDAPGTAPPVLAYPNPTPEQVQAITRRMYEKTEQRRGLGMKGRSNVLKNFSSERYLREHEQMLWIGKQRSRNYKVRGRTPMSSIPESWMSQFSLASFEKGEKRRGVSVYSRVASSSALSVEMERGSLALPITTSSRVGSSLSVEIDRGSLTLPLTVGSRVGSSLSMSSTVV